MCAGDAQPLFASSHEIGIRRIDRWLLVLRSGRAPFADILVPQNVGGTRTQQPRATIREPADNDDAAGRPGVRAVNVRRAGVSLETPRGLVSLTSYGYSNQPNTLYGPYFGDAIAEFYRSVRSG